MAFQYLAGWQKRSTNRCGTRISVEETSVAIHPGQAGRSVDIPATLERLTAQMQPCAMGSSRWLSPKRNRRSLIWRRRPNWRGGS